MSALLVGMLLGATACSSEFEVPSPKTLPFTLKPAQEFPAAAQPVDLDGDGVDEIAFPYDASETPGMGALVLERQTGGVIDQLNFDGRVRSFHLQDLTGDGRAEMLISVLRNDSLFLSVANGAGRKLYSLFLIDGQPRIEPEGTIAWDPGIVLFATEDLDGDGHPELITVINTRYARLPRGVLVHSLPEGRELGRALVGAAIHSATVADFDGDGSPEVVASTGAWSNGAAAGGFDDDHAYLLVFRLVPEVAVEWSKELGSKFAVGFHTHEDFDGDHRRELLAMTVSPNAELELELLEPGTWRTLRRRTVVAPLTWPIVVDLDRDGRPEILAVRSPGEVWVLNSGLEMVENRRVANGLQALASLPDLDGDGVQEIVAMYRGGENLVSGFAFLDPDLRIKAVYPTGRPTGILRRGVGVPPYLLVEQDGRSVALSFTPNPFYLVHRHGPTALAFLGTAAVLLIAMTLVALRRRNRLLGVVQTLTLDNGGQGVLLLNRRGRIRWMNGTARHWLALEGAARPRRLPALARGAPELVEFCEQQLAADPPQPSSTTIPIPSNGGGREVELEAEPVLAKLAGDPHWLVRLQERTARSAGPPVAWAILAQRVAHDVKNPLTSMLLTLQHLQREYRERAPEASDDLDRYANRIAQRIDQVRQLTNNFLKFVDLRELERTPVDMNRLVRDFSRALDRSLPPDICLNLELEEPLPEVRVDEEQLRSLLDNLVTNAVNALPRGGTITLATRVARGVQWDGEATRRDYLTLEVLDTGTGIPRELRERIFEPGVTTAEHGSGLGLALVRKIVADHGGQISVQSEEGTGSAFCAYFPLDT